MRRSASRRARPRRWRSSANPVAASRRLPRCCSGWKRRSSGAVSARQHRDPVDADRGARRRHHLLDPDGVPESVRHAEPQPHGRLADHPHAGEIRRRQHGGRAAAAHARAARPGQAAARLRQPHAAPAVRRAEAAHRRGARLCRPRQGGGRRRAGLGARRLGAGGRDRAADGHPAADRRRRCCSSATTSPWCATSPTAWW